MLQSRQRSLVLFVSDVANHSVNSQVPRSVNLLRLLALNLIVLKLLAVHLAKEIESSVDTIQARI